VKICSSASRPKPANSRAWNVAWIEREEFECCGVRVCRGIERVRIDGIVRKRDLMSGLEPAGPELRRRPEPISLRGRPGVEISRPLCAQELGLNLQAATRAGGLDAAGREGLLKYVLRPPIATERVQRGPDGLVRIALKRSRQPGLNRSKFGHAIQRG
jgi:hypothetical protein